MRKLVLLSFIFSISSCVGKALKDQSSTTMIPQNGKVGIYWVTDKEGNSIKYIPVLNNRGPCFERTGFAYGYKKYFIPKDRREIAADRAPKFLDVSKESVVFVPSHQLGSENLGVINSDKEIEVNQMGPDKKRTVQGHMKLDLDVFERELPTANDGLYFIPEIQETNPIKLLTDKKYRFHHFSYAKIVDLNVDAVLSENKAIVIMSYPPQKQLENLRDVPIGLPVFSKKSNKIVGFIKEFKKLGDGSHKLRIMSIFSLDDSLDTIRKESLSPPLVMDPKEVVESFGEGFKRVYCSRDAVRYIIAERLNMEKTLAGCVQEPSTQPKPKSNPKPPWEMGSGKTCSVQEVLAAIEAAVQQDESKRSELRCMEGVITQGEDINITAPQYISKICPLEVKQAIEERIKSDQSCQKAAN